MLLVPTHSISCLPATACYSVSSPSTHRPLSLLFSVVAMMLLQKPQPAHSSPRTMSLAHRRQSSAPLVVVQPTRIPGLLSLSKPPRSSPPRNQQRHSYKNAPKQALAASATAPSVVRAHPPTLTPTPQIYTAPTGASPQSRGRAQEMHPKDMNLDNKRFVINHHSCILTHSDNTLFLFSRSASQSSLRASGSVKHHNRQASPPIPSMMTTPHKQNPSQAEVPVNFANHLDPFVDSTVTPSPSPRKQPFQSKATQVTTSLTNRPPPLARSDPLPILSKRHPRQQQQRLSLISKRVLAIQEFPICDDMSEIADDDEPSTPIARRLYAGAPSHSAPISTTPLEFFSPSAPFSSPQKKQVGDWSRNRKHRRTPSDGGVFHMSSDEEVSSGPGGVVLNGNSNMKPLLRPFNLPAFKATEMNASTPARAVAGSRAGVVEGSTMNMSTSVDKAAFFASSVFQNSPSPDELPDPLEL